MLTRRMTYGEDLRYEVRQSPFDYIEIAKACRTFEDAAPSTYQALLDMTEESLVGLSAPKRKQRRRLRLVCLAVGIEPGRYGLTDEDRSAQWPSDKMLAKQLRKALRAGEASPRYSQLGFDLLVNAA